MDSGRTYSEQRASLPQARISHTTQLHCRKAEIQTATVRSNCMMFIQMPGPEDVSECRFLAIVIDVLKQAEAMLNKAGGLLGLGGERA